MRRRTRHPDHRDAVEKSQGENQDAGSGTNHDNDQEQDQDPGQREKSIDDTHQELVEPSADEAKPNARHSTPGDGEDRRNGRHDQRLSTPEHGAREYVAPQVISAEPVLGGRRVEDHLSAQLSEIVRRDRRRTDRQNNVESHENETHEARGPGDHRQ